MLSHDLKAATKSLLNGHSEHLTLLGVLAVGEATPSFSFDILKLARSTSKAFRAGMNRSTCNPSKTHPDSFQALFRLAGFACIEELGACYHVMNGRQQAFVAKVGLAPGSSR